MEPPTNNSSNQYNDNTPSVEEDEDRKPSAQAEAPTLLKSNVSSSKSNHETHPTVASADMAAGVASIKPKAASSFTKKAPPITTTTTTAAKSSNWLRMKEDDSDIFATPSVISTDPPPPAPFNNNNNTLKKPPPVYETDPQTREPQSQAPLKKPPPTALTNKPKGREPGGVKKEIGSVISTGESVLAASPSRDTPDSLIPATIRTTDRNEPSTSVTTDTNRAIYHGRTGEPSVEVPSFYSDGTDTNNSYSLIIPPTVTDPVPPSSGGSVVSAPAMLNSYNYNNNNQYHPQDLEAIAEQQSQEQAGTAALPQKSPYSQENTSLPAKTRLRYALYTVIGLVILAVIALIVVLVTQNNGSSSSSSSSSSSVEAASANNTIINDTATATATTTTTTIAPIVSTEAPTVGVDLNETSNPAETGESQPTDAEEGPATSDAADNFVEDDAQEVFDPDSLNATTTTTVESSSSPTVNPLGLGGGDAPFSDINTTALDPDIDLGTLIVPTIQPTTQATATPTQGPVSTLMETPSPTVSPTKTDVLATPQLPMPITSSPSLGGSAPTMQPATSPPTAAPLATSLQPISDMSLAIQMQLPDFTMIALQDPNSPQSLAYSWLSQHPDLDLLAVDRMNQLFALATFYYSFQGEQWSSGLQKDWLSYDVHECSWGFSGLSNALPGSPDFEACDAPEGFYQNLLFGGAYVPDAKMPKEIALLSSLEGLVMTQCNLTDAFTNVFPDELLALSSLQSIILSNNDIVGTIPFYINQLQETLLQFWVEYNNLSGELPDDLWDLFLLESLDLRGNSFSGTLSTSIGKLASIRQLFLGDNRLSGIIPSEIGLLSLAENLALFENAFEGPLPSEVGLMTQLSTLRVFNNLLSSRIPSEIGLLDSNLQVLDLDQNQFDGTLPSEIGLLSSLEQLNLLSNQLRGPLPTTLASLSKLKILSLSKNSFTNSSFPDEILGVTSLEVLFMGDSGLSGTIPPDIGQSLSNLAILDLSLNRALSGQIPSELGLMTQLVILNLQGTDLTGEVPLEVCNRGNIAQVLIPCGVECPDVCPCLCSG